MKRSFSVLFTAIILSLVLLNGCKKEELPSLSCKMDGSTWTSLFRLITMGATDLGDGFLIVATTGASTQDGAYLSLLVRGTEAKEYDLAVALSGTTMQCGAIYFPNGISGTESKKYIGRSGKITITEVDTEKSKISGTFSFTLSTDLAGTEKVVITEGKFENLKYVKATISVTDFLETGK